MKQCGVCHRSFHSERDYLINTFRWRVGASNELLFNCSCGSTLVLKKGQYEWFDENKLLSPKAREIFLKLAIGEAIPRLSKSVIELQRLLDEADSEIKDIAKAVKLEPVLLVDVLKIANLAKPGDAPPIHSIEHAVTYVGRRLLRDLVAAAAIKSFQFKAKLYKERSFWMDAFLTGMIAEGVCRVVESPEIAEQAYAAACLQNIGKVVQAVCVPEMADRIYQHSTERECSWLAAEQALNLPEHTIMGEIAAVFWSLPEYIFTTALTHHSPIDSQERKTVRDQSLVNVVIVANYLRHKVLQSPTYGDIALTLESGRSLGMELADIDGLVKKFKPLKATVEKILS